jgi:nucleoid-associated protein YgaU
MIIRRGDNLWQIARRLYGQGVRYSTIYAANTDQIGDPDMIYPGQVFVIPEGDRNWQPSEPVPPAAVN